jgi:hypothetical protein
MEFQFLNALRYLLHNKFRFAEASFIGPVSFEEHVRILGSVNVKVSEDANFKRIQWEDVCTFYVFRFKHNGEFDLVEREIWYEYKWPSLAKSVVMKINRQ